MFIGHYAKIYQQPLQYFKTMIHMMIAKSAKKIKEYNKRASSLRLETMEPSLLLKINLKLFLFIYRASAIRNDEMPRLPEILYAAKSVFANFALYFCLLSFFPRDIPSASQAGQGISFRNGGRGGRFCVNGAGGRPVAAESSGGCRERCIFPPEREFLFRIDHDFSGLSISRSLWARAFDFSTGSRFFFGKIIVRNLQCGREML